MIEETKAPLVSVVMAVFNGYPHVEAAVNSIIQQTYENLQIIIINDGSTDQSSDFLRRISCEDRRILLVEQDNVGLTESLIRGMDLAAGEYIARMDADDYSHPQRIEKQMSLMLDREDLSAVSCGINYICEDGSIIPQGIPQSEDLVPWFMCFYNEIAGHGQILMRRSAYKDAGGYDASYKYAQDYDLFSRMFRKPSIAFVNEHLYDYRTSGQSITNSKWAEQQDFSFEIMRRSLKDLTGQTYSGMDLKLLRQFWVGKGDVALNRNYARQVQMLLRTAFDSYVAKKMTNAALQQALKRAVAVRWAEISVQAGRDRRWDAMAFLYFSATWMPRVAARMGTKVVMRSLGMHGQ